MLSATHLSVQGRHSTLVPPTTLEAARGSLVLVQADGQSARTALSLILAGRMKPSTGSITWASEDSLSALRRRSALVDSPEVNEPEAHLSVRSLVAEDLALLPRKVRNRSRPTAWLAARGYGDIAHLWMEQLPSGVLLKLQLELALTGQDVDVLVVDSPDRHGDDALWPALLSDAAAGSLGSGEPAVVAVVGRIPTGWDGPTAFAGNAVEPAAAPATGAEPDAVEPAAAPASDAEPDGAEPAPATNSEPEPDPDRAPGPEPLPDFTEPQEHR